MGVFGSVWRFFKRHKRKFFLTGTVITGGYFVWKYVRCKLEDYQENQMAAAFATARKQTHFESNQRTCLLTINSLVPSLRNRIMSELNCERLTQQLQLKPTNKVHIWSELKLMAFTRAIVSIYSTSILVLTLRVQLNVIGGCIYARSEKDKLPSEDETYTQQQYLELIQYFLNTGVRQLCEFVQHSVEKELLSVSLKHLFTIETLTTLVERVRSSIEKVPSDVKTTPFFDFVTKHSENPHSHTSVESDVSSSSECTTEPAVLSLSKLISETSDIIRSQDYHTVLQGMIDHGFEHLLQHLSRVFATSMPEVPTLHLKDTDRVALPTIALAKLIAPLVGSVHTICNDTTTEYLQQLLTLSAANEFTHQIYESFCQPITE